MIKKTTPEFSWQHYLPDSLRAKIANRPNLSKILSNISWVFGDRILRMVIGLLVSVWVARYLGPEQFGLLNFAMAFVAIFGTFATLGLQEIVVRDIVKYPSLAQEILGTSFLLQLVGGLIAFLLTVGVIGYLRPDDPQAKIIVAIFGFALLFRCSDGVKYWFESQVQTKYTIFAGTSVFLGIAVLKVGMIIADVPLIGFVWTAFVEALVTAIALLAIYTWKVGNIQAWHAKFSVANSLLKDSWPLIISGLAIMVYIRIDQIMLGQMSGNNAVGVYTAAIRISEVWYFTPVAIVASVFPSIINAKKSSQILYERLLQKLYDLMFVISLTLAVLMTFLADWLVTLLYGQAYHQAGTVLAIHIWAGIFVFLGVVSGKWLLIENLQKFILYRAIWGAIVNVGLNYFLIPRYGIYGAAVATVISQAIASVLLNATNRRTRLAFVMQCKSLFLPELVKLIR